MCPWPSFLSNGIVPIYRLIVLAILILLLRRLPVIYAMHWKIDQIKTTRDLLFTGYFGPIGVSAMFYLHISLQILHEMAEAQLERQDIGRLSEVMTIVVWFLTISSIVSPPSESMLNSNRCL